MNRINVIPVLICLLMLFFMPFNLQVRGGHFRVKFEKTTVLLPDSISIKLEKTHINDMPVLFIHDTAATTEAIGSIVGKDYSELMQFAHSHNLAPLKFMGWYYTAGPPWLMDVAIVTNRLPEQTGGRIQARIQIGGEVLVAHVWGSYNQIGKAYMQIENWLRQNNRTARENSFEVYINDPNTVVDPSDIQTDIYQPLE